METFKYWWRLIVWYPLDISDRILLLVGAVSGYLHKGDDPVTINLAWQIPLGAFLIFLIWRLMQMPVKVINDIRRERQGLPPLTLEGVGQRIKEIESTVGNLKEKVEQQRTSDVESVKKKVFWNFKALDDSMIGGITRAIVFVFEVTNASSVWIGTTGNVKGDLIVLGWKLLAVPWKVDCNGIGPDSEGEVRIVCPVSENFARTLAFKPKDGSFHANFSEIFIEFETKDNQGRYTLGYMSVGNGYNIPITDHVAFERIRKVVEWEENLGKDNRITK